MTPEQEEQVRRALAAAAGRQDPDSPASPESMPPEVAARLDGVLAELAAPRRAGSDPVDAPATSARAEDDGVADRLGLAGAAGPGCWSPPRPSRSSPWAGPRS